MRRVPGMGAHEARTEPQRQGMPSPREGGVRGRGRGEREGARREGGARMSTQVGAPSRALSLARWGNDDAPYRAVQKQKLAASVMGDATVPVRGDAAAAAPATVLIVVH